jgi:hypothetical protein
MTSPRPCKRIGRCLGNGGANVTRDGVGVEKRDLMPEMYDEIDLDQQSASNAPSTKSGC